MTDLISDILIFTCGIVIVIAIVTAAFVKMRAAERRMHENSYKMDIAKKDLALTLNRLNLIASSGVLKSVSDLLDLFNESKDKEFDPLRLHNILNTIVIEARRDLNPSHAQRVEESRVRYRFFAPSRK